MLDIGYRAPTPIPSTRYDYTERIITKQGVLGRLKVGFKSLGTDIEEVCLKYHDLGKRKFFWTLWAKNKSKYESYEEFKANWDPSTPIWKTIAKEINADIKRDVKDALNAGGDKNTKSVSHEVNKLLRNKRPFNKK